MLTRSVRIDDECKQTERDGGAKETVEERERLRGKSRGRKSRLGRQKKDTEGYE